MRVVRPWAASDFAIMTFQRLQVILEADRPAVVGPKHL
jgi:hypothetical protein